MSIPSEEAEAVDLKAWAQKLACCRFCHILLVKAITECTQVKRKRTNTPAVLGCGINKVVPSLICHRVHYNFPLVTCTYTRIY